MSMIRSNLWVEKSDIPKLLQDDIKLNSKVSVRLNSFEVNDYFSNKDSIMRLRSNTKLRSGDSDYHTSDEESKLVIDEACTSNTSKVTHYQSMPDLEVDSEESEVLSPQENQVDQPKFVLSYAPDNNPIYGSAGYVAKERAKRKPKPVFVESGTQYKAEDVQKFCHDCITGKTFKDVQEKLVALAKQTEMSKICIDNVPSTSSVSTSMPDTVIKNSQTNVQMTQIQVTRRARPLPELLPLTNGPQKKYVQDVYTNQDYVEQISMKQINFPISYPTSINPTIGNNILMNSEFSSGYVPVKNFYTEVDPIEEIGNVSTCAAGKLNNQNLSIEKHFNHESNVSEIEENESIHSETEMDIDTGINTALENVVDVPKVETVRKLEKSNRDRDNDTLELHSYEDFGKDVIEPNPENNINKPKKQKLDPFHRVSTLYNEEYERKTTNSERFKRKSTKKDIPKLVKVDFKKHVDKKVNIGATVHSNINQLPCNSMVDSPSMSNNTIPRSPNKIQVTFKNPNHKESNSTKNNPQYMITSSPFQQPTNDSHTIPTISNLNNTTAAHTHNHQVPVKNNANFKVHSSMLNRIPGSQQRNLNHLQMIAPNHAPNAAQSQNGPRKIVININQLGKRAINYR